MNKDAAMNFEIKLSSETGEKELYLFDEFQASWDAKVSDMKIIQYAIGRAVEIGKETKAKEVREALGL